MKPSTDLSILGTILICIFCLSSQTLSSQNEVELRTDGVVVPRTNVTTIGNAVEGMLTYNAITETLYYYSGDEWLEVGGGFVKTNNVVHQYNTESENDVFIFGKNSPPEESANGNFFFFDKLKGAFRGGTAQFSEAWNPENIGATSFAYGFNVRADGGNGATALGYNTAASGDNGAIALGHKAKVMGSYGATAIGKETIANGNSGTVVGQFNDTLVTRGYDQPDKPLFIVGNGFSNSFRSNALVVRQNGKVGIGENLPTGYMHIKQSGTSDTPHLVIEETQSGESASLRLRDPDNYWTIASQNRTLGTEMTFELNGGTKMLVLDSVFINSTTPLIRAGIGRSPSSRNFEVQGTAGKTTAGDWSSNSDRRIKTDIKEIKDSYSFLEKLRPVKFKYTEEWKARNPSIKDQYYYNFIAQEYQEVFPTSVHGSGEYLKNDDQEILQIDTYNAQIATIAAVKELIKENAEQKEINKTLQIQINELKVLLTGLPSNALSQQP